MNTEYWTIDEYTTLVRSDAGLSIIWAGAEFGPVATLEEICEDELLDQCQSLLTTPGIPCKRLKCDVGPFGDSQVVLMTI